MCMRRAGPQNAPTHGAARSRSTVCTHTCAHALASSGRPRLLALAQVVGEHWGKAHVLSSAADGMICATELRSGHPVWQAKGGAGTPPPHPPAAENDNAIATEPLSCAPCAVSSGDDCFVGVQVA